MHKCQQAVSSLASRKEESVNFAAPSQDFTDGFLPRVMRAPYRARALARSSVDTVVSSSVASFGKWLMTNNR
eukprot:m.228355 g.228355  ORF g.228355 m.228355 type:complete len:72 (-) comp11731_c0_seq1:452-667(-)